MNVQVDRQTDRQLLLLLSRFSRVRLCATPEMAAHQTPLSLGFSRQEPLEWVAISVCNRPVKLNGNGGLWVMSIQVFTVKFFQLLML